MKNKTIPILTAAFALMALPAVLLATDEAGGAGATGGRAETGVTSPESGPGASDTYGVDVASPTPSGYDVNTSTPADTGGAGATTGEDSGTGGVIINDNNDASTGDKVEKGSDADTGGVASNPHEGSSSNANTAPSSESK